MSIEKILLYVLVMVMGIFLFVLLQQHITAVDSSAWTFDGHVEAALFLGITPMLFLISLVLIPVYFILKGEG